MNVKGEGKEGTWEASDVLRACMEKKGISQAELVRLCTEKGYQITQGSVSRVLTKKKKMSLEECRAFCDVLNISADMFLFSDTRTTMSEDSFFLLSDREMSSAKGILGDYDLFFASTAQEEKNRIIDGELKLYYGKSCIHANIDIHIKNSAPKKYKGYLWIGSQAPVAYIIVKKQGRGEISVVAFRYRKFEAVPMKCRTALCLTTSAGEKKEPVVHRIALIRRGTMPKSARDALVQDIFVFLKNDVCCHLEVEEDMKMYRRFTGAEEAEYE